MLNRSLHRYVTTAAAVLALATLSSLAFAAHDEQDLLRRLKNHDYRVRLRAAYDLKRMGHRAKFAIPALLHGLGDENGAVVSMIWSTLEHLGPEAYPGFLTALQRVDDKKARDSLLHYLALFFWDDDSDDKRHLREFVPVYIKLLDDSDPSTHHRAAYALSYFRDSRAIGPLRRRLVAEPNQVSKNCLAFALAEFGGAGKDAIPVLMQEIRMRCGGDADSLAAFINCLGRIGLPSLPTLATLLRDKEVDVRREAAKTIGEYLCPKANEASLPLLPLLTDTSDEVRLAAVKALAELKRPSSKVLRAIRVAFNDSNPEVQIAAAMTLFAFQRDSEASQVLISVLKAAPDREVFESAARSFRDHGKAAIPAIPVLLKALRDPERQRVAVDALEKINGSARRRAVHTLVQLLDDRDVTVRVTTANTLAALGNVARVATPALVRHLGNQAEKQEMREATALALGRMGDTSEEVLKALHKGMGDSAPGIRIECAGALGKLDPKTLHWVTVLVNVLNVEKGTDILTRALDRLDEAGTRSHHAHALLLQIISRQPRQDDRIDVVVRRAAMRTLIRTGAKGSKVVKTLATALSDPEDSFIRCIAADCLAELGPGAKEAIPALVAALKSRNWPQRARAAHALKRIGPAAKKAVAALEEALFDSEYEVRRQAEDALNAIELDGKPDR